MSSRAFISGRTNLPRRRSIRASLSVFAFSLASVLLSVRTSAADDGGSLPVLSIRPEMSLRLMILDPSLLQEQSSGEPRVFVDGKLLSVPEVPLYLRTADANAVVCALTTNRAWPSMVETIPLDPDTSLTSKFNPDFQPDGRDLKLEFANESIVLECVRKNPMPYTVADLRRSFGSAIRIDVTPEGIAETKNVVVCDDYYRSFPEREKSGKGPDASLSRCLGKIHTPLIAAMDFHFCPQLKLADQMLDAPDARREVIRVDRRYDLPPIFYALLLLSEIPNRELEKLEGHKVCDYTREEVVALIEKMQKLGATVEWKSKLGVKVRSLAESVELKDLK